MPEVSSDSLPELPNKPGASNWVEKAGGLPSLIKRVAKHLQAKGRPTGVAIATAVNWAKKMCSSGTAFGGKVKVHMGSQAAACKAVAEWEAKKGKSHVTEAEQLLEAGGPDIELTEEDAESLLHVLEARLERVELVRVSLSPPGARTGGVQAAKALLEAEDTEKVTISMGGPYADRSEATALRRDLGFERSELRALIECLGGALEEAKKDPSEEAADRVKKVQERGPRDRPTGGHSGSKSLTKGATGELVNHAQTRLKELGYDVEPDGNFGGETDDAVRTFQGDHKLKVDGEIGRETKTAMRGTTSETVAERRGEAKVQDDAASPKGDTTQVEGEGEEGDEGAGEDGKPETTTDTTGEGDTHDWLMKGRGVGGQPDAEVKRRQEQLIAAGTYIGETGADGRFGPETEKGVKRVQRRFGLKTSGVIDPETGALLDRQGERDANGENEAGKDGKDLKEAGPGFRYATHDAPLVAKARRQTAKGRDGKPVKSAEFERLHPRVKIGRTGGGMFIAKGDSGGEVRKVQEAVGAEVDGKFGDETARKLRAYQERHGLQVDGKVGAQTAAYFNGGQKAAPGPLGGGKQQAKKGSSSSKTTASKKKTSGKTTSSSSSAESSSSPQTGSNGKPTTFASGASGPKVSKIQRLLGLDPTGTFDKATVKAIRDYQEEHGLLVDGIVGSQTLSSLLGKGKAPVGKITPDLLTALENYKPQRSKPSPSPKPSPKPKPKSSPKPSPKPKVSTTVATASRNVQEAAQPLPAIIRHDDDDPLEAETLQDRLDSMQTGETYLLPGGVSIVRSSAAFSVIEGEDAQLLPSAETATTVALGLLESPDASEAARAGAAALLGEEWTPERITEALDELHGRGIDLDPATELPETIAVVIKAANIGALAESATEEPSAAKAAADQDG